MGKRKKYIVSQVVEDQIKDSEEWYRQLGLKRRTILSYSSRFREFAAWFEVNKGRGVTVDDITESLLKKYKTHLYKKYPTLTQIQARFSTGTRFRRLACEPGISSADHRTVRDTSSETALSSLQEVPRVVHFIGEDEFKKWMLNEGRKHSTIRRQIQILRSIGEWSIDRGGGVLSPKTMTPGLLFNYLNENDQPIRSYNQGIAAAHNYVLWAINHDQLEVDPFVNVMKRNRRATDGDWKLIDKREALEFLDWVSKESGVEDDKAYHRVQSVSRFFRWYYLTKGKMITYREIGSDLIIPYDRYLRQTKKPPSERRPLAGSTIIVSLYAARWYLKWAEYKKGTIDG